MNTKKLVSFLAVLGILLPHLSFAQNLGPVENYTDLILFADMAEAGDTLLISGDVHADETRPLTPKSYLSIRSQSGSDAVLSGLHLMDAQVSFSDIRLEDSLTITGTSSIILGSNVRVSGSSETAVDFTGNGELIIDPACTIQAASGGTGIRIHHNGGTFYGALEGTVSGGEGEVGGTGIEVSPFSSEGLLLIGGTVSGGDGRDIGGNAVNLYDITGNAYISITGNARGGDGYIGGDGMQIVSVHGTSNIGIIGNVNGGDGEEYGGSALILMNADDASAVSLSGSLTGGNSVGTDSTPGQSLILVGNGALNHMISGECRLQDGIAVSAPVISDPIAVASVDTEPSLKPAPEEMPVQIAEAPVPAEPAPILTASAPKELPEAQPASADSQIYPASFFVSEAAAEPEADAENSMEPASEPEISAEPASAPEPEAPADIIMESQEEPTDSSSAQADSSDAPEEPVSLSDQTDNTGFSLDFSSEAASTPDESSALETPLS